MKQLMQIFSSLLAAIRQVFLSVITYFKCLRETRSRYYARQRKGRSRREGAEHLSAGPEPSEKTLDIVYPRDANPDLDKLPMAEIRDGEDPFSRSDDVRPRILRRPALLIGAAVCILVITVLVAVSVRRSKNEYSLEIALDGDPVISLEYGTPYADAGAAAVYRGSVIHKNDNDAVPVTTSVRKDPVELGTYLVHYTASYEGMTAGAMRVVHVVDTVAPELSLTTDPDAYTLPGHPYEEEGFTASDNHDGDLTGQVSAEERDGHVYYTVTDASGNTATADRTIVYDDRTAPVLTLNEVPLEIIVGDDWQDSFTAVDDLDGDITKKVEIEGKVDNYKEGSYTLKYKSTDEHGNESTAERTVVVDPLPKNDPSLAVNGDKIVFLTFDDGPSEYTSRLLETLEKYDVKATFFVTGLGKHLDLIGQEAAQGHTVGVHSLTHDYDQIYENEDAFWADFDAMNDIIEQQTGSRTNIMRFPGGSSNTVSSGNEGLMTRLTVQAQKKGYDYYDWNAYDGDVYETNDPKQIAANIIEGIQQQSVSVVLCHDTKEYTVDGIEDAIRQALKDGYTFLPITFGCFECHHTVQN